jgi:hypothetical protein
MAYEDREGGVWIKAECPRLVPKSTRLVASCSSRRIRLEIAISNNVGGVKTFSSTLRPALRVRAPFRSC